MNVPTLQSRVLYGLRTDVAGNAQYITDNDVLYPVGSALAIHNFSQRRQRLLRLPDKHPINIIAVTPNKKYVAVCETGEKPTIGVYDVHTLKKKKTLGIPYDAPGVTRFSCISFSHDSRCLAAVTGEPDQTMLFYAWEKGKVESSVKVGNPQNARSSVRHVTCNPGDAGVVALGGPCVFKFLTVSETVWRPYGFAKADNILVSSMCWLNVDRLLAGTRDARILYLENGDLKNIYDMSETVFMNLKIREEYVMQTTAPLGDNDEVDDDDRVWESDVRNLVALPRGFAFGFGLGTVVVFEREGQHKYTKRNVYVVPTQVSKDSSRDLYRIHSISGNPSSDRLLVTTGWSQLFQAKLWGPPLAVDPEPQPLQVTGQHLHHGAISGLSVCAWKSVFMTCGESDRSVRIWDHETESLVMMKQYQEDICSVALHPMGLFCLVGFSDKLRFMSILMDDLKTVQEIPIRNCRTVGFSHGGHLFAAVNGNIIQVYSTIGFANRHLLKGHTGKIRGISWSQTDTRLVSVGSEGAIYDWDTATGHRSAEVIVKGISLRGVALSADGATAFCIADDRRLREIRDGAIVREYRSPDADPEILAMGRDDGAGVFVASPGGAIVSLKMPLRDPLQGTDFHLHRADVTCMSLSYDEKTLISAAADGTLCFWKIGKPAGGATIAAAAGDFKYTSEVLIGKNDLEDKVRTIADLATRMRELETEHAYRTRQTEVQHNDRMREVHRGYCEAIEELRERIETMREDRTNELNNINAEIARMKAANEAAMRKTEQSYDARLIEEYDKYQRFEERNNEMRENYERRIEELERKCAEDAAALVKKYEAQVHAKSLEVEETHEEMAHQVKVHEKIKRQIEDDTDREIAELRTAHEAQLHNERQTNLRLKGEAGVLRNKYFAARKEIDELKRQATNFHGEQTQLQRTIQDLERDARDLKKEIGERDATIQEKEKRVGELKRNNQELEKFKFVLNYKIRELKGQIEPRDREIEELKAKILDMETELINLHRTNVSLELQLQKLREKLSGSRRESQSEQQTHWKCRRLLNNMRVDLANVASLIQRPNELKAAVTKMHRLYSADEGFARGRDADLDAQCEFFKQRDHLERTVESLRRQATRDTSGDGGEAEKMLDENVTLIVELNALREELKRARKHIGDMESLLGLSGRKLRPAEARERLADACHGKEEVQREYRSKMLECERIVANLQDYIRRLLGELETRGDEDDGAKS